MQEKRVHRRVPIEVPVVIERRNGPAVAGVAKDVSMGGMFIEAQEEPDYGEEVIIVGRLPGSDEDAKLPAVVRWSMPKGFGIQFGLLGARDTRAIGRLLQTR